jgi:hypothetical protein
LNYYTFIATQTEEPGSSWHLVAGIDETSLTNTLSNLCDGQVPLDRIDTYLLAISIIYRKTKDLLKTRSVKEPFRFSPFESLQTARDFGTPDFKTGGLTIWVLDSPG